MQIRRHIGGADQLRTAASEALDAWIRAGRAASVEDNVANGAAAMALDDLLAGRISAEEARRLRAKFRRKADEAHDAERRAKAVYDAALAKIEAAA